MASGCCAIGSDVEGVREVIENGVTGRLVPPLDPQALANALTHLAADPEEGKRLAESGLRMVKERFNKCVMQKRYRQLLRCLMEGRQFSPDVGQAGWSP